MSGATLWIRSGLLLVIALSAGMLIGTSSGQSLALSGSATAVAVTLTVPGSSAIEGGAASSTSATQAGGSFRFPEDGSLITVESFASSAFAREGDRVAQAVVDVPEASLFGGEIVVAGVATRARARVDGEGVAADAEGSSVASLTVSGQVLALTVGQPTPIGDWGSVVVGAREVEGKASHSQIVVTSLRLTLVAEHRGFPAGTEITIGTAIAELEVEEPEATIPAPPTTTTATAPDPRRPPEQRAPRPPSIRKPQPGVPVRPIPQDIDVTPELTKKGYVFPIFGQAWYSSTLGAARANTGWHHGPR